MKNVLSPAWETRDLFVGFLLPEEEGSQPSPTHSMCLVLHVVCIKALKSCERLG